jgi:hypothetical protein
LGHNGFSCALRRQALESEVINFCEFNNQLEIGLSFTLAGKLITAPLKENGKSGGPELSNYNKITLNPFSDFEEFRINSKISRKFP